MHTCVRMYVSIATVVHDLISRILLWPWRPLVTRATKAEETRAAVRNSKWDLGGFNDNSNS